VSAGADHGCGVTTSGSAYCWGKNDLPPGLAAAWLGGCSDAPPGPCSDCPPPQGLVVSDPLPPTPLAGGGGASALASGAGDSVVYVSLPPGTAPAGTRAIVRRVGNGDSLTTAVIDGGFDPVPVAAQADDSIEVVVLDAGGGTVLLVRAAVRARRPPIIVRTDPPRDKTDVPVNSRIVIVFSEPVDGGTVTNSSVQLLRGTTPIAGTVSLLQGTTTAAVFTPSAQLTANAGYRLVVTQAVRDLSGDALEDAVAVDFSTGTSVLGPVASVIVQPDSIAAPVGSLIQFTATALDSQGAVVVGRPVVWSSTASSVAPVTSTGLVTALAEGDAVIQAQDDCDGRIPGLVVPAASGSY